MTTQTTGTAYRWGSLGTDDVGAWAELVNHLAVVDGTEEFSSAEDLAEELRAPGTDPERDTVAVWAGDTLVGYGATGVPQTLDHEGQARAYLDGGVHADHRGRGLGTELVRHLEQRAQELLAQRHPDVPGYLSAGGGLDGSGSRELLGDHGYAVVRYFNLLGRDLADPPAVAEIDGVELRTPTDEDEEAVRLAHNAAFRDHWGSGESDAERWHERWVSRSARPAVSTVAVARGGELDGQVLAYVMAAQWVDREAYVAILGTVAAARGRGIAAAALARTIGLAAASGDYDVIELDVDSDSPTGATRLYERLGFALKHRSAAMRKPLTAPTT
ncbi:GNAT family N-acetyltransferase [Serinicoccus hydrothermalis]|nr:GNAT family N-acetyltransferase [Serinicoccus hydrothermalis]